MKDSMLSRIIISCIAFLFLFSPLGLYADEIDSSLQEKKTSEIVKAPKQMSNQQMNDLFGEDPYLGQTSYLQSPDGFNQRDKSK